MKIKKSDITMAIQWIEVQIARDDNFPFKKNSEKAAKRNLKALKAWRKCTSTAQDIRDWCDEWLSDEQRERFELAVDSARSHKADQPILLTKEAALLLDAAANASNLSPSELIVERLSPFKANSEELKANT